MPFQVPPNQGSRNTARSTFTSSVEWLANTLAVVVAFFATGPAYTASVAWIVDYTDYHYGSGFEDGVAFAWGIVVAVLCFLIARASLATLLVMGGLSIAARVFA